MKKTDIILLSLIVLISLLSYFILQVTVNNTSLPDGIAKVVYLNEIILEIDLADGEYRIKDDSLGIIVDEDNFLFTIPDTNGTNDLVIEYKDNYVRVKEETSPRNICSKQSWSNSPLKPLTCLPNNLVIIIVEPPTSDGIDDTTS